MSTSQSKYINSSNSLSWKSANNYTKCNIQDGKKKGCDYFWVGYVCVYVLACTFIFALVQGEGREGQEKFYKGGDAKVR